MAWFVPALIAGASALSGLLANRGKTSTQQQSQNLSGTSNATMSTTGVSTPFYDEGAGSLRDKLLGLYSGRLQEPTQLADIVTTQGLQNLNRGNDIATRVAQSVLASRGLQYSPISAKIISDMNRQRIMKGVDILNQKDLLIDELMKQRLADASSFFARLPYGTQTTSTGTQTGEFSQSGTSTGTVQQPGNMLGGMFTGLGQALAALYGSGAFGNSGRRIV